MHPGLCVVLQWTPSPIRTDLAPPSQGPGSGANSPQVSFPMCWWPRVPTENHAWAANLATLSWTFAGFSYLNLSFHICAMGMQ